MIILAIRENGKIVKHEIRTLTGADNCSRCSRHCEGLVYEKEIRKCQFCKVKLLVNGGIVRAYKCGRQARIVK
jgi:hypothetical protein